MTPPKDITQGEWVKDGHVIRDDAGKEIASCLGDGRSFKIDIANARMMAASKELAQAANDCLPSWYNEVGPEFHDGQICCEITYGDVRAILKALTKAGYTP